MPQNLALLTKKRALQKLSAEAGDGGTHANTSNYIRDQESQVMHYTFCSERKI